MAPGNSNLVAPDREGCRVAAPAAVPALRNSTPAAQPQQACATLAAARPAQRPTCPREQNQQRIPALRRACQRCLQSRVRRVSRPVCSAWQHGQAARVHTLLQDWHSCQSLPATRWGGVGARASRAGESGTWVLGGRSASTENAACGQAQNLGAGAAVKEAGRLATAKLESRAGAQLQGGEENEQHTSRPKHALCLLCADCMPHFCSCGCCKMMTRPASRSGAVGSVAHKHTELGRLYRKKKTAAAAVGASASSAAVAAACNRCLVSAATAALKLDSQLKYHDSGASGWVWPLQATHSQRSQSRLFRGPASDASDSKASS